MRLIRERITGREFPREYAGDALGVSKPRLQEADYKQEIITERRVMKSKTTIYARTRGRWPAILHELGIPDAALSGKHTACPACGGKDRFRYCRDEAGGFFCADMRGKGGVDLVMHVFGLDFRGACERIETIIGRDAEYKPTHQDKTYAESLLEIAKPTKRSSYLGSRGLEVAPGLLWATDVEYHDDGKLVGTYPAMLAPVTHHGKFKTFHVTYLHKGRKAPLPSPRKILPGAPISGAGVVLYAPAETMGVAEGIETAIAAKMLNNMPVHSALNASMLAKWDPPSIAREVHIFADHDANFAGEAGAYQLAHRLALKGISVTIRLPEMIGDWNDVLLNSRAAA